MKIISDEDVFSQIKDKSKKAYATLQTRLDLYNSELALASSLVLLWNLCVRSEI